MVRIRPVGRLACAVLALAIAQGASAQTPLDKYLEQLKTLRAEFSQVVTEASGAQVQKASGKLVIVRPGRFRWEIAPRPARAPRRSS